MRMKSLITIALLAVLTSCSMPPNDGYYDANGNYVMRSNNVYYDRAGYYDYNGYYVNVSDRIRIPQDMFPPRGMCRIWLPNNTPANQPRIESCDNIQSRVPVGAYVVYGGQ